MGISTNSGQTTVTGSVSVTGNTTSVALSILTGLNNSATVPTTLGTVPANKVWRIYGWSVNVGNTYTSLVDGYLKANTGNLFAGKLIVQTAVGDCSTQFVCMLPASTYIEITAGQTVTMMSGHASTYYNAQVFYQEVAV